MNVQLVLEERKHVLAADLLDDLQAQRVQQVPLCHGTADLKAGNREHVPVEIQLDAVRHHDFVYSVDHAAVAFVAAARQLAQLLLRAVEALARHGVERHVRRARLIRMVRAPVFKRRAGQRHARLKTARRAHIGDFARFAELARARDGIVIHDAAGVQTLGAGKVHRRGRRIGREGMRGVNMVVGELGAHDGRNLFGLQQHAEVFKALLGRGRVQKRQNLFLCHECLLSSA